MKIKNKLRLGFGFLFLITLFYGLLSLFYIQDISKSAKIILKNNYETLNYTKAMRAVLDDNALPLSPNAVEIFNDQLNDQEHNITESGEKPATAHLRQAFNRLTSAGTDITQLQQDERTVRQQLRAIETLNMQAIVRKNDRAHEAVNRATLLLSLVGTFTFLILFSFSVNFPDVIADPLRALLEGIQEISQKNYSQRLNFDKEDEFGEVALAFNTMASRLNEWENSNLATVLSEKRRIETIIEQMQDAIIGISEKREVLFINDAARNLLNLTNEKVIGQNIDDLSKGNDLLTHILTNKAGNKPFKVAVDHKEAYFQAESREITVPNLNNKQEDALRIAGVSAGMVYILKNVTEFKERDEAKTNFIATISHELKTPIAAVKMSLKLLKDERVGSLNTEQQELLAHIEDDNARLLKITSELLNLSQVETGNIQLNFAHIAPAQIINYALASIRFQAEQKGVQIDVLQTEQLPDVYADVEKTAWVLVNFLSNALRYSPAKSKVVIQARQQNNQVLFSVKDQGKGIDEQYQKRLFDRYFQVPTDGQNKSGSGLGLAISRDFIEAQQGKIWVESAIGEGSIFSFSLPVV
ncbi:HAMP domain-containing sensor histidine kinase [Mucilaginibacter lacusdianchii]|uniref:HAMP domain-containing sensor histidine kinase n=1 Tax=Mucilaginibacter lacusdianchii TaxID=2684211 RepID=UPI00131B9068|nr:ATP-binding protein [Mucilaginibacter sp. JXJ CY 39]